MRVKLTREEIGKLRTEKGGFLKRDLEVLGVPWPPARDWIEQYLGEPPRPKKAKRPKPKKSKKQARRERHRPTGLDAVASSPDRVVIYTDGGCWPNPGAGGWGAVLTRPDGSVTELTGGENPSSNNRMELMGPIAALESLEPGQAVLLYSDSQYVINGITGWIDGWKRKGWVSSQKQPVKNRELWECLDAARALHQVTFKWVKGHAGIAGNERADRLSQKGAIEACGHAIDFSRFRYQ